MPGRLTGGGSLGDTAPTASGDTTTPGQTALAALLAGAVILGVSWLVGRKRA